MLFWPYNPDFHSYLQKEKDKRVSIIRCVINVYLSRCLRANIRATPNQFREGHVISNPLTKALQVTLNSWQFVVYFTFKYLKLANALQVTPNSWQFAVYFTFKYLK